MVDTSDKRQKKDQCAKIIGIVQLKGGAGRSTIATNLAAGLSQRATVALIDCDLPQGTSAAWGVLRREIDRAGTLVIDTAMHHQELVTAASRLRSQVDYIVIDGPPRVAEITRAILVMSDICLLPLSASAAEVWALSDLFETIKEARQNQYDVNARIIWNRYRKQTRSAREFSEQLEDAFDLPQLKAHLGFRVAYSDVLARGLWAGEWHDAAAKREMSLLINELLDILVD